MLFFDHSIVMNRICLFVILLGGIYRVSSLNLDLTNLEETLLYSQLNNSTNLKIFYEKILQSNGIEHFSDLHQCFTSSENLMKILNISSTNFTREQFKQLNPALISMKFNKGCQKLEVTTKWKNVIIGLISITIINLTALFGIIILPFRNKSAFKWILCTFIGLAVGTLLGTGIFHLIPMAFSVETFDHEGNFLNKALLTIIVIYLFFIRDELSKAFLHVETIVPIHHHGEVEEEDVTKVLQEKNDRSLRENLRTMKPIGWMILISDTLHGFIEGITIGAIAMVSIGECIRMMVAIACEEFSHKLGDAAVLLSSGLPIKQALLMNFLSACGCYPGFLLGAKLGQLENFHPWICALAGGMFVYIGLTDMIPELISMGNEIEKDHIQARKPITKCLKIKILLSQNLGIFIGLTTIYFLAKYGDSLAQYF